MSLQVAEVGAHVPNPPDSTIRWTSSERMRGPLETEAPHDGPDLELPLPFARRRSRFVANVMTLLAALVLLPALQQQLDHSSVGQYRATEILFEYPQETVLEPSAPAMPHPERTRLERGTFFHTGASEEEIRAFFAWDPAAINATGAALRPLWGCRAAERRNPKLVFNHMPRTGGVTVRALLRGYALLCGASLATVSHCTFLGRETMAGDTHWANGYDTPRAGRSCLLSATLNRTGQPATGENRPSTSLLQRHDFDIVAGHFPMGSDEFWTDPDTRQHVAVQNLVFFRQPLEKFVSQYLTEHRTLAQKSAPEIASSLYGRVLNKTARGEYSELYSRTLIRPEQRTWVEQERVAWTSEQRLHLSLRNLVESRTVVGILERMEASVELVRYLLDRDHDVPDLAFRYFASNELAKKLGRISSSGNRAKDVVYRIRQDPDMLAAFNEYLKYEQEAYQVALQIHERQVDAMESSQSRRNIQ